mmetsp:Transcript_10055/g.61060  ORF Transcript_10055/g.61060 Transcript_10055/m.61060 type:complete len:367 (-) Transcript_10055:47-1147(-)
MGAGAVRAHVSCVLAWAARPACASAGAVGWNFLALFQLSTSSAGDGPRSSTGRSWNPKPRLSSAGGPLYSSLKPNPRLSSRSPKPLLPRPASPVVGANFFPLVQSSTSSARDGPSSNGSRPASSRAPNPSLPPRSCRSPNPRLPSSVGRPSPNPYPRLPSSRLRSKPPLSLPGRACASTCRRQHGSLATTSAAAAGPAAASRPRRSLASFLLGVPSAHRTLRRRSSSRSFAFLRTVAIVGAACDRCDVLRFHLVFGQRCGRKHGAYFGLAEFSFGLGLELSRLEVVERHLLRGLLLPARCFDRSIQGREGIFVFPTVVPTQRRQGRRQIVFACICVGPCRSGRCTPCAHLSPRFPLQTDVRDVLAT